MCIGSATLSFPVAATVFLLSALTLLAKSSRKWGRAGGVIRGTLAVFYAVLVLAGIAGLGLSVWLCTVAKGAAFLLLFILFPVSMFLLTTGSRLFRFVLNPPAEKPKPIESSGGWSELESARQRQRNAGVAPHLRPEVLRKSDKETTV
jgi:hypothetical protein